ncbi:hypothetical protein C8034_v007534 [Colletotrichum sidae]|nr:hypothetical protein C8035_v002704 [Colletotrichum spinosum]TDZ74862.1 hypothetical protein CTRI78_v000434 [Colletotrichum trifolii]TEA11449.1 hypothetical protein C8034_v007534 [Colletotrichum sidae]
MAFAAEQSRYRERGQVSVKESKRNMGKILDDIIGPLESSSKKDKSRSSKSNKSKDDKKKRR